MKQPLIAMLQGTKLLLLQPNSNKQVEFELGDMIYAGLLAEAINKLGLDEEATE